jgi:motility quorum-sensing regulator / GCU-specific mRNA interferase toxin
MEKKTPHCDLPVVKGLVSHAEHRIWQDVYRPKTPAGDVYIKLTVIEDVLIVSFKEL